MKHRPLNSGEIKSVKNILTNYIGKNIENFKFENLYVLEDKGKYDVIYANKEVLENLKNFRNIYGAGISFGSFEVKSGQKNKIKFSISLEGMSIISSDIIKNYVVVNKKGETLFLYGRDVFKSSILEINGGGKVAVFNKNKELLGIGSYGGGDIIKNIIDNAIKYTNPGGKIEITLKDCELIVSDTGIGISKEKLSAIFDRFHRANNCKGGLGLGLNIVKEICNRYNIQIKVSSTLNVGSTFNLRW